jgi:WhiB family redox-sensing transcriptional regulator
VLVALADLIDCTRYADQEWRRDARCRGVDPKFLLPLRGASHEDALRYCRECVVRVECLAYALSEPHATAGVWGGTSYRDRRTARHHGWDAAGLIEEVSRVVALMVVFTVVVSAAVVRGLAALRAWPCPLATGARCTTRCCRGRPIPAVAPLLLRGWGLRKRARALFLAKL